MFNPFPLPLGTFTTLMVAPCIFLCVIEAPSQEVAKQLVRESVPSEYCESVVVRPRES